MTLIKPHFIKRKTLLFQMNKVEAGGATVFPYVGARLLPSEVRHTIYKPKNSGYISLT